MKSTFIAQSSRWCSPAPGTSALGQQRPVVVILAERPLYEDYRSDMMPIQDRYVALIADYMRQYESGELTDEDADEMLEGYFDIKSDLLRKRKKYIRRFRKILPMLKVARFYQLENKMNASIDAELALLVPLVESN